jgi:hypothetical protein
LFEAQGDVLEARATGFRTHKTRLVTAASFFKSGSVRELERVAAFGTLIGNLDVPCGMMAEKHLAEVAATERPSPG